MTAAYRRVSHAAQIIEQLVGAGIPFDQIGCYTIMRKEDKHLTKKDLIERMRNARVIVVQYNSLHMLQSLPVSVVFYMDEAEEALTLNAATNPAVADRGVEYRGM